MTHVDPYPSPDRRGESRGSLPAPRSGLAIALHAALAACLGSCGSSSDGPAPEPVPVLPAATTVDLGTSVDRAKADGLRVAFTVSEAETGGADLNGDGDGGDLVLFVHDANDGSTLNVGVAVEEFEIEGRYVLFVVPEAGEGVDFNGDGDFDDRELRSLDVESGLQLRLLADVPFEGGGKIVRTIQLDLDGARAAVIGRDDDALAYTLHFVNLATGDVTDTGLLGSQARDFADGAYYGTFLREWWVGTDLNGDGDTSDDVAQAIDVLTGNVTNVGIASGSTLGIPTLTVDEGYLVVGAVEALDGADHNGDGFLNDTVLFVHEFSTGLTTNTEIVTFGLSVPAVVGRRVVAFDDVGRVAVWEPGVGMILPLVNKISRGAGATDDGVLFSVPENSIEDLNGDGDEEDDVLFSYVFETGVTTNLGVSGQPMRLNVGTTALAIEQEVDQGRDLNGDGDELDIIVYAWDRSGGLRRLAIEGWPIATVDGSVVVTIIEEREADLNGDGDMFDAVVHAARATPDASVLNLELALSFSGIPRLENVEVVPLRVDEFSQGGADLNGDGDSTDEVLHLLRGGLAP